MSLLQQIESGARLRPRRILLYGARGVGTSTFAATFPKPVFVPTDDSVSHLDCDRFPAATRFGQVLQALQELYREPHAYRTVVLDPLDTLERLIVEDVRRERGVEHIEAIPFGEGHSLALESWHELLSSLEALRDDLKLTCVLVARARTERAAEATAGAAPLLVERSTPDLHRRVSAAVQSWCDEVLFAACVKRSRRPRPGTDDAKQKPDVERVLYTTPGPTHVAKNRLGLPPRIPMNVLAVAPPPASAKPPFVSWN